MAKPGSNGARRIARGRAVDLRVKAMTDDEAREAQEILEHHLGARCNGCGRRIGIGIKFTSLDVRDERPVMSLAACNRQDCDFAEQAREGATFMEMVEFVWLDENGIDAPPSLQVQRRNAALARHAASEETAEPDAPQLEGPA